MKRRQCDRCKSVFTRGVKGSLEVRVAARDNRHGYVDNPERFDFCAFECAGAWLADWAAKGKS